MIHQRMISSILILQLLLPVGGIPAYAQETKIISIEPPHPVTQTVLKATMDPVLDYIMRQDIALPDAEFNFDSNDPVMDQDPFFMRSQRWVKRGTGVQSPGILTLKLDETGFLPELEIQNPFHEILRTDDFIFLAANDEHYFDNKVLDSEGSQSQGIFILSREYWQKAALNRTAVPLFFLPLHEGSWGKNAVAYELKEHDAIYFTDQSSPGVPIPLHDLEILIKAESLNLMMATSMSLLAQKEQLATQRDEKHLAQLLLPLPGSTAGFGVVFTGMSGPHKINLNALNSSSIRKKLQKLNLIPNAFAAGEGFLSPAVLKRIIRVGVITGVSSVLSIVLRSTIYRDFFARQTEKAKLEGKKSSWIARNTKYYLTVQAHAFLLLSQIPSSTFANALEYVADRYFPKNGAGEQTAIRKFLKTTVLRTRDNAERVPVSYWTMMMGTGVIGTIDTTFVAYQTYVVVPEMMKSLGEHFPALKERADEAVDINNPNLGNMRRNDVIRNAVAYITTGAASYSLDIQAQLRQYIEPNVEAQMLKEGINPHDPKNFSIRQSRVQKELEIELKSKGLPGSDEFLFDYSSIYENTLAVLGFKTEGTRHLIGTSRPGLTLSALDRAIAKLKKRSKLLPDDVEISQALEILKRSRSNASFLRSWIKRPLKELLKLGNVKEEFLKATNSVFEAKLNLLSLTYEGDRNLDLEQVPSQWVRDFSAPGARIASQVYRETFYDLVTGQKTSYESEELTTEIAQNAVQNSENELKARLGLSENATLTPEQKKLNQSELHLIFEKEKLRLITAAEDALKPYEPPQLGVVERFQLRRAVRKADENYLAKYHSSFDAAVANEEEMKNWQKIFIKQYANHVGFYPEQMDSEAATHETEIFTSNPKVKDYLQTLSSKERATTVAMVQAQNEIDEYIKEIVNNPSADALSPGQPGITQRLRQKSFLRKSTFLSKAGVRALRVIDSMAAQVEYRLGLGAWIYRNVPFTYDTWKAMVLTATKLPTVLIASYIWNRYLWSVDYPISMWTFSTLLAFTVSGPSRTLNRFFQNQGIKPMGKIGSVILLGVIYSWVTFFGFLPNQLFAADFQSMWDWVGNSIKKVCSFKLIRGT